MRSLSSAFCWEIFARGRYLLLALVLQLLVIVLPQLVMPFHWTEHFASGFLIVLITGYALTLSAFFMYAQTGPTQSSYPANRFTLPVTTHALVRFPMLALMVGTMIGWLALWLALLLWGYRPPFLTIGLAAITSASWLLALCWWPFASAAMRGIACTLICFAEVVFVLWPAVVWDWGTPYVVSVLVLFILGAYLVGWRGVAIDRRGDGRVPLGLMAFIERVFARATPALTSQATARQAQSWIDWTTKGVIFLALSMMACFLFGLLLVGLLWQPPAPDQLTAITGMVLASAIAIPFTLSCVLGQVSGMDECRSAASRISAYLAVKPVSSAFLAWSRMRTTTYSALISWGLMLAIIPIWVLATGNDGGFDRFWNRFVLARGEANALSALALALIVLLLFTWRCMLGGLVVSLTGRPWVGTVLGLSIPAIVLPALGVAVWGLNEPRIVPRILATLPWLLGLGLALKLAGCIWAYRLALAQKLITKSEVARAILFYLVHVGLVVALIFTGFLVPWRRWEILIPLALLMPSLGRFALIPLAMEWNRRR